MWRAAIAVWPAVVIGAIVLTPEAAHRECARIPPRSPL
jgi:hypothetical protein